MANHSSFAIIPAPILHDSDLSPRAKLLVGLLYNLTDGNGYCCVSNNYLADDLGMSTRTVQRWLKELRESPHFQFSSEKLDSTTVRRIYPTNPDMSTQQGEKPSR